MTTEGYVRSGLHLGAELVEEVQRHYDGMPSTASNWSYFHLKSLSHYSVGGWKGLKESLKRRWKARSLHRGVRQAIYHKSIFGSSQILPKVLQECLAQGLTELLGDFPLLVGHDIYLGSDRRQKTFGYHEDSFGWEIFYQTEDDLTIYIPLCDLTEANGGRLIVDTRPDQGDRNQWIIEFAACCRRYGATDKEGRVTRQSVERSRYRRIIAKEFIRLLQERSASRQPPGPEAMKPVTAQAGEIILFNNKRFHDVEPWQLDLPRAIYIIRCFPCYDLGLTPPRTFLNDVHCNRYWIDVDHGTLCPIDSDGDLPRFLPIPRMHRKSSPPTRAITSLSTGNDCVSIDSVFALEPVESISVKSCNRKEFLERFLRPGLPCILEDVVADWPAFPKWTKRFFLEEEGETPIRYHVQNEADNDLNWEGGILQTSLADFIRRLDRGERIKHFGMSHPLYDFATRHPTLLDDIRLESFARLIPDGTFLGLGRFDSRFWPLLPPYPPTQMFIAGAKNQTPGHYDPDLSHSFHWLVWGSKSVTLFPFDPEKSEFLRRLRHADLTKPLDPKLRGDLPAHQIRGWFVSLKPGQTLLIPSRVWHYFKNEETSMSFVVRARSFNDLAGYNAFAADAHSPVNTIPLYAALWRQLEPCQRSSLGKILAHYEKPLMACIPVVLKFLRRLETARSVFLPRSRNHL